MSDRLQELVRAEYAGKAASFFEKVKAMGLADAELSAVPSLFIPGWGDGYDASFFKVAVAGMETVAWSNEYGDSLKCDIDAHANGQYDVAASCRLFRKDGPAEWRNTFWQYPATILARLFKSSKSEVLQKDDPLMRSVAWFNGHSIETFNSRGVDQSAISPEKMARLQEAADECGLSDFAAFADVFKPDLILYFYRNQSGVPNRCFPKDIEFVRHWGDHDFADEYRICGRTILLQFPHTTWLRIHHIPESEIAETVYEVLRSRNVRTALCEKNGAYDFFGMSAADWMSWVAFVRGEAAKYPDMDNMTLSHHLMSTVAKELAKHNATMNAQTLVLILNEVDKFRKDNWQYSKERRGPCASVAGAYRAYEEAGSQLDADCIAEAFTKLDGTHAWE